MRTVNNIMRKLWKHIYKGSDTTSIQIRTEPTDGVGTNKRNYNYKLVQTKHGCEMDMRGRCSAGQKVISTFCIELRNACDRAFYLKKKFQFVVGTGINHYKTRFGGNVLQGLRYSRIRRTDDKFG